MPSLLSCSYPSFLIKLDINSGSILRSMYSQFLVELLVLANLSNCDCVNLGQAGRQAGVQSHSSEFSSAKEFLLHGKVVSGR